jgi:transposase
MAYAAPTSTSAFACVFDLAVRTSVVHACGVFGVHRSTFYAWKRHVDRHGLEMLRRASGAAR